MKASLLCMGLLLILNGCSKEDEGTALFDLNHFYVSIDRESFEAFRDHPQILPEYFEGDIGMPEFQPVNESANIIKRNISGPGQNRPKKGAEYNTHYPGIE